jgi:hypothetical protein
MSRMTLVLVSLATALMANPAIEYFFSEIQVAPDSLERIELHMYSNERPYPVDLSGWQLTTYAGVATIDSGVVLQDSTDFVVISRENVSGTFALGDDWDDVRLEEGPGIRDNYSYGTYGWTPPAGMSVAIYTHWEGVWPDEYLVGSWYLDPTPTLGAANDDRLGGIAGRVLDRFGQPLKYCWVRLANEHGNGSATCDSTGRYVMSPLGPGTYEVSAHSDSTHLPAYYPESVSIDLNGWRDSINITIYAAGVAEEQIRAATPVSLGQRGRSLVLAAGRSGTALVRVFDNLGRVRMSKKFTLVSGSYELPLYLLSSGIYFASCRFGERTASMKLVLY